MLISAFRSRCAMSLAGNIEVGAKYQAVSVRSQVMGLVSGPRSRWLLRWGGVPVFVFSDATDWRRMQKRRVSGPLRRDETTSIVARCRTR